MASRPEMRMPYGPGWDEPDWTPKAPPAAQEPQVDRRPRVSTLAQFMAIMRTGERGAELLLVVAGSVRVERPGRSVTLGPGELIGEIEVLDPGGGRIADIFAVGSVRCMAISREQLLTALETDPRAAIALIEVLAARFRETA